MIEVRIHGRGGQGVVTAAEMLSIAAFWQGRHAQAFPSFGSERTGAPMVAFCRIDDKEIRLREPILAPDVLIVQKKYQIQPELPFTPGTEIAGTVRALGEGVIDWASMLALLVRVAPAATPTRPAPSSVHVTTRRARAARWTDAPTALSAEALRLAAGKARAGAGPQSR